MKQAQNNSLKRKRVPLYMDDQSLAELDAYCECVRESRTTIIRAALRAYMKGKQRLESQN